MAKWNEADDYQVATDATEDVMDTTDLDMEEDENVMTIDRL